MKVTLKSARINASYGQSEVAKRLGVSPATVVAWEKGRVSPRYNQLKELCNIYNIEITDLKL